MRFPTGRIAAPMPGKQPRVLCPVCQEPIPPDETECENCGAFVIDEAVVRLSRAFGLDREKALKLFEQGFRHPKQLKDRDPDNVLETGEVGLLFICTNCGGFVASGDSTCPRCAAEFETESPEAPSDEEDILDLVLCPACGADNDADIAECEICGEPLREGAQAAPKAVAAAPTPKEIPVAAKGAAKIEDAVPKAHVPDVATKRTMPVKPATPPRAPAPEPLRPLPREPKAPPTRPIASTPGPAKQPPPAIARAAGGTPQKVEPLAPKLQTTAARIAPPAPLSERKNEPPARRSRTSASAPRREKTAVTRPQKFQVSPEIAGGIVLAGPRGSSSREDWRNRSPPPGWERSSSASVPSWWSKSSRKRLRHHPYGTLASSEPASFSLSQERCSTAASPRPGSVSSSRSDPSSRSLGPRSASSEPPIASCLRWPARSPWRRTVWGPC